MTTSDFQRVRELFLGARRLSGAAREAYLVAACGEDDGIRAEVESLLNSDSAPSARLAKTPNLGVGSALWAAAGAAAETPERIGQYRIIRPLGEGAMGCVYEAEQDHPRRRVAIKVLRAGMLSPQMLHRFEREAQILGLLKHPGIAQIYEAGTFGVDPRALRPFLAMEYVEGAPLGRYLGESNPPGRARLALVARICDAVQHAHDRGVIHRDLKPANIMVVQDKDGTVQPKVLDFGVARVADPDFKATTVHTGLGQIIGTVAYMSPEQAAGNPEQIDPRSDVYALGVILYEVMAGRLPYELSGRPLHDAVRIIREVDPAPLSTVNRTLRGDLETIAAKALEKERERRYASAGAMAADIRHYLADEPINARPATRAYHLSKFAKRNKALVGGLAATGAALAAGTVISTVMYFNAERARWGEARQATAARLSEARATEARAAAEREARLKGAVNDFILNRMLRSADPAQEGRDIKVADVLDQAAREAGSAFADDPLTEAAVRHSLAQTYQGLGVFAAGLEQGKAAYAARVRALGEANPETIKTQVLVAQGYLNVGNPEEAEREAQRALAALGERAGERDLLTLELWATLADAEQQLHRFADAEARLRKVIAAREALLSAPDDDLLYAVNILGTTLFAQRKFSAAAAEQRRFLDLARELRGPESPGVIVGMTNVANTMMAMGQVKEAEAQIAEAIVLSVKVMGPDHRNTGLLRSVHGRALTRLGRLEEAEREYVESVRVVRGAVGDDVYLTETALNELYEFYMMSGQLPKAEAAIRQRLEIRRKRGATDDEMYIEILSSHIVVLNRTSGCREAESDAREAIEVARRVYPAGDARIARVESWLGESLLCLKRYQEAEAILLRAYAAQNAATGIPKRDAPMTAIMLAQLYDRMGRPEEAKAWDALAGPDAR